ncbi:MAG: NAD-dependent epimerase/dehydratase family protein, partial [Nitrospirales bacterium]|nr:NAD-dependent epimerase/dehydratase family protein [Nitrospirales bacterium]
NSQYGTNFLSVMPTNLYGPRDNFDLSSAHVLPALMRKMHEAKTGGEKEVIVWGTGAPRRELLYSEDLAEACLLLMDDCDAKDMGEFVNIGVGEDITIRELAGLIAEVVGFDGRLTFDASKPDGTPRKLLDIGRMTGLGWRANTGLLQGLRLTYSWYKENAA